MHQPIPSGRGSNNPQSLPHREAAWPATGALLYSNAGRRRAHLARRGRRAAGFLACLYMGGTAIPKQPFHATARLSISTSAIGNVSSSSLDIRECSDGSHRRGDVSGRLTSDWSPGRTTAARLRTGVLHFAPSRKRSGPDRTGDPGLRTGVRSPECPNSGLQSRFLYRLETTVFATVWQSGVRDPKVRTAVRESNSGLE